jgi:hypothetical protein
MRASRAGTAQAPRQTRLGAGVRKQVEAIYLRLDAQLASLAEIQLQVDDLRWKIKHM